MFLTEVQKIGVGLLGFGTLFIFFGIMLLFDTGLMAIGNFMWIGGGVMFFGLDKTKNFLLQARRIKGLVFFLLGIVLILLRWPKTGFAVELFGFLNLFADLFPMVYQLGLQIPVLRDILSHPFVAKMFRNSQSMPV